MRRRTETRPTDGIQTVGTMIIHASFRSCMPINMRHSGYYCCDYETVSFGRSITYYYNGYYIFRLTTLKYVLLRLTTIELNRTKVQREKYAKIVDQLREVEAERESFEAAKVSGDISQAKTKSEILKFRELQYCKDSED